MPLALYRKYRPRRFAELVGQEPIRQTVQQQMARKQVAHAYLFSGPRGVGKTTVARIVARAINCQRPDAGEPDNTCAFCTEILEGRSLDIIEIDAASNTGVDHVREHIIENARFTPQRLPYKVFIIDEVHMLSSSAFNALLKTLEEPPAHVIFIMATTEVHRVPQTILSRCQRFDFQRIRIPDLLKRITFVAQQEGVQIDEDVARSVARRARGASRDAEVLLAQLIGLGEKHITRAQADLVFPQSDTSSAIALLDAMRRRDASAALDVIARCVRDGVHMDELMAELIELTRVMVYVKATGTLTDLEQGELDDDTAKAITERSHSMTLERLATILQTLIDHTNDLRLAPLPQIPLELAVLSAILEGGDPSEQSHSAPSSQTKKPSEASAKRISEKSATTDSSSTHSAHTFEQVMAAWPEVLKRLHADHRGLYMMLKTGHPLRMEDGILVLGFGFKLLAEQAVSERTRFALGAAVKAALGEDIEIRTEVIDRDTAVPQASETQESLPPNITDILKSVGGQVVSEE